MNKLNAHNNFYYFTASLVFLLLASSAISSTVDGGYPHLLYIIILLTELVAYFSLNLSRQWRQFIAMTLVLMLIGTGLREFTDWSLAPLAGLIGSLIFFCGMAYVAGKQVFSSGGIELNQIIGTIALYLLLGIIWALLYLLALEFWPNGINGIEHKEWNDNFGVTAYYSYVTMTSLGYGDITPAVPVTRTLAYLQAITGIFYMAVVVAGMMGAFRRNSK